MHLSILTLIVTLAIGACTVSAIIFTPYFTLKIQKGIEKFNEEKQRQLNIFKTLLATRENTVSLEHVQALNMIDIEFYCERAIRENWNVYRDHLHSYPNNKDKGAQDRWEEKRVDYMTNLLYEMSLFFGYTFDKVLLKKGAYTPVAHGIMNLEQQLIRKGFVDLLSGEKPIKVEISEPKQSKNNKEPI